MVLGGKQTDTVRLKSKTAYIHHANTACRDISMPFYRKKAYHLSNSVTCDISVLVKKWIIEKRYNLIPSFVL